MWVTDIALVGSSHARLAADLARLTDADSRRPSLLPGWTVGHVLTHLARNADSLVRMLKAAARGDVVDQYPGGNDERAADIERGAGRAPADLVADVVSSADRLEEVMDGTAADVWRLGRGRVVSGLWPLDELPFRRWREVEIHHVDLGLGYTIADWPDAYVDAELARSMVRVPQRLGRGTLDIRATDSGERWTVTAGDGVPERSVAAERRVLVAWLVGRGDAGDLPDLRPWTG